MLSDKTYRVEAVIVNGKKAYGITNGKKWFFYAYEKESKAKEILNDSSIENQLIVNIAYPQPLCVV